MELPFVLSIPGKENLDVMDSMIGSNIKFITTRHEQGAAFMADVGVHKMWMAHMYQAERPNTCIISKGFASMGIGLPGVPDLIRSALDFRSWCLEVKSFSPMSSCRW